MVDILQEYGPTQPLPVLVTELNRFYHEHEAAIYERTHPEIFEQLPELWGKMFAEFDVLQAQGRCSIDSANGKLRILNIGCGTGFEARQCLKYFGGERVDRLVCLDPSDRMLDRCRQALEPWGEVVNYVTTLNEIGATSQFDLLITNGVLHHMVDPVQAIRDVMSRLASRAVWLCGHEPSKRFYENLECKSVLLRYDAHRRWMRFLSPQKCLKRLPPVDRVE